MSLEKRGKGDSPGSHCQRRVHTVGGDWWGRAQCQVLGEDLGKVQQRT